jgi:hypothetical protein
MCSRKFRGPRKGKPRVRSRLLYAKLGCLAENMKIKSPKIFSLLIKDFEIIEFFLQASLKDENYAHIKAGSH